MALNLLYLSSLGFDMIQVNGESVFWKSIGKYGEHVILRSNEYEFRIVPDLVNVSGTVTFYRGVELMEREIYQEIVYEVDDLLELMKDACVRSIIAPYKRINR